MFTSRSVKKRRAISLDTKRQVIEGSKNVGTSVNMLVERFGLPRSTILTILKNEVAIMRAIDEGGTAKRARCTSSRHSQLETALLNWIDSGRLNEGSSLSGQLIQAKAKELAEELQIDNFKASNGWLQKFNSRYRERFSLPTDEPSDPIRRPTPVDATKYENWQEMGLTANDVLKQLLSVEF